MIRYLLDTAPLAALLRGRAGTDAFIFGRIRLGAELRFQRAQRFPRDRGEGGGEGDNALQSLEGPPWRGGVVQPAAALHSIRQPDRDGVDGPEDAQAWQTNAAAVSP